MTQAWCMSTLLCEPQCQKRAWPLPHGRILSVVGAMELYDLISKLRHLHPIQKKYHVDGRGEYAQLVFDRRDLQDWYRGIEEVLGPPVKAENEPVSDELLRLTEDFGEIFDHQILFCIEKNGQRALAMFWPWRDRHLVTLKLMVSREGKG